MPEMGRPSPGLFRQEWKVVPRSAEFSSGTVRSPRIHFVPGRKRSSGVRWASRRKNYTRPERHLETSRLSTDALEI